MFSFKKRTLKQKRRAIVVFEVLVRMSMVSFLFVYSRMTPPGHIYKYIYIVNVSSYLSSLD